MLTRAATAIGSAFEALLALGRHTAGLSRRFSPATALAFALALAWLVATGWWSYLRPQDFDASAYERYQAEVARCRDLDTSEARYECVAKTMIGRDRVRFGTAMFVFLPPILLVFGRFIWREVQTGIREREHARLAEIHSRERLSRYRREMMADRAAAAAARALLDEEARQRRTYDPYGQRHVEAPVSRTPPSPKHA